MLISVEHSDLEEMDDAGIDYTPVDFMGCREVIDLLREARDKPGVMPWVIKAIDELVDELEVV